MKENKSKQLFSNSFKWLQLKPKPADLCSCWCLKRRLLFFLPQMIWMTQKFLSSLSITSKSVVEMDCRLQWWWASSWDSFSFWRIKQKERRTTAVQIYSQPKLKSPIWMGERDESETNKRKFPTLLYVAHVSQQSAVRFRHTQTHTHTRGRERKGYIVYAITLCILRASSLK